MLDISFSSPIKPKNDFYLFNVTEVFYNRGKNNKDLFVNYDIEVDPALIFFYREDSGYKIIAKQELYSFIQERKLLTGLDDIYLYPKNYENTTMESYQDLSHFVLLITEDKTDIGCHIGESDMKFKRVVLAKSLVEAKTILRADKVDVVITDLNLPDSQGVKTVECIVSLFKGICISVVDSDNIEDGKASVSVGASDFILKKDLNKEYISKIVRNALLRQQTKEIISTIENKLS